MATTLTNRMVVAIVALDKKTFTNDEIHPLIEKTKGDFSINTVNTILGRDFKQKGWIERLGNIGQRGQYTPTLKLYQDNYRNRSYLIGLLNDPLLRKKAMIAWQNRIDHMPTDSKNLLNTPRLVETKSKQNNEEKRKKSIAEKRKESMRTAQKFSNILYEVGIALISKGDLVKAFMATKVKPWSSKEILNQVREVLPGVHVSDQAAVQPIGRYKKKGWCSIYDKIGMMPVYKCDRRFFIDNQSKMELYCDALPDKAEKIRYNFEYFLAEGSEVEEDVPAAEESTAKSTVPSASMSAKADAHHVDSALQESTKKDNSMSSAAGQLISDIGVGMPASYVIGKCICDYLSMVSVDAVPIGLITDGSHDEKSISESDANKQVAELQHELIHKIDESSTEIKSLTAQLSSVKSKNTVMSHRLEEALREKANLQRRVSELTIAIEKANQSSRQKRTTGGNGANQDAEIPGAIMASAEDITVRVRKGSEPHV